MYESPDMSEVSCCKFIGPLMSIYVAHIDFNRHLPALLNTDHTVLQEHTYPQYCYKLIYQNVNQILFYVSLLTCSEWRVWGLFLAAGMIKYFTVNSHMVLVSLIVYVLVDGCQRNQYSDT